MNIRQDEKRNDVLMQIARLLTQYDRTNMYVSRECKTITRPAGTNEDGWPLVDVVASHERFIIDVYTTTNREKEPKA